jgi:hypothetical protein
VSDKVNVFSDRQCDHRSVLCWPLSMRDPIAGDAYPDRERLSGDFPSVCNPSMIRSDKRRFCPVSVCAVLRSIKSARKEDTKFLGLLKSEKEQGIDI